MRCGLTAEEYRWKLIRQWLEEYPITCIYLVSAEPTRCDPSALASRIRSTATLIETAWAGRTKPSSTKAVALRHIAITVSRRVRVSIHPTPSILKLPLLHPRRPSGLPSTFSNRHGLTECN